MQSVLGKSPLAYFQSLRVERAVRLLKISSASVDEVAARRIRPRRNAASSSAAAPRAWRQGDQAHSLTVSISVPPILPGES